MPLVLIQYVQVASAAAFTRRVLLRGGCRTAQFTSHIHTALLVNGSILDVTFVYDWKCENVILKYQHMCQLQCEGIYRSKSKISVQTSGQGTWAGCTSLERVRPCQDAAGPTVPPLMRNVLYHSPSTVKPIASPSKLSRHLMFCGAGYLAIIITFITTPIRVCWHNKTWLSNHVFG